MRAELGPRAADWPLVVADSADPASLAAMATRRAGGGDARSARTAAPGCRWSTPASRRAPTTLDLTGEVLFVRECMERHDRAAEAGVRIVNSCGFDSIPSDLGTLLLAEAVRADGAGELGETTLVVKAMKGGLSGGTLASLKGQVDDMKASGAARKVVGDPYSLSPDRAGDPDGRGEGDLRGVARDEALGQWIAPFVMAPYNTRIVRRSNALQDWAYGRGFRYREVTGLGNGRLAPVVGAGLAGGIVALAGGLAAQALADAARPRAARPRRGAEREGARGRPCSGWRSTPRPRRARATSPGSPPRATPATRRPR